MVLIVNHGKSLKALISLFMLRFMKLLYKLSTPYQRRSLETYYVRCSISLPLHALMWKLYKPLSGPKITSVAEANLLNRSSSFIPTSGITKFTTVYHIHNIIFFVSYEFPH